MKSAASILLWAVGSFIALIAITAVADLTYTMINDNHDHPIVSKTVLSRLVERSSASREDAIQCVLKYVDGLKETKDSRGKTVYVFDKKDGCVSEDEISWAKSTYLAWYERQIADLETNAKIMRNCDFNMAEEDRLGKPHCIDRDDMVKSNRTCLATPARINKLYTYICNRAIDRYPDME